MIQKSVELFEEKEKELARSGFENMIGGILSLSYGPSTSPDLFTLFREK
jgi:hypothetical protein